MQHARRGRGEDRDREMTNAAPPPDLITGWRGSVPFLTAGASTQRGPICRTGEGGLSGRYAVLLQTLRIENPPHKA
jgi:hypothetical protein